ncbi:hypothetical protein M3O96_15545 [Aquiflexum sp. TKW24L]|uniref:hypothetical protein n=1 Tax=Aquiflexum sp. TKW24L TaxID=2942212 RepID=UPI0020BFEC40|nr:hypothetical protein [Aquiflexum sp. TKW24L]MCL6260516.1 hypothetical protein [Aquiflexum sp. TKW24L]
MNLTSKLLLVCLPVTLLFFQSMVTHAQKIMSISEELHQNGEKFEVVTKGGGRIVKYHFNSYRVTSAKGGWVKGKSSSGLFSAYETASSEKKLSFEFVSDQGDTAVVYLNRNMNYEGINKSGLTFFGNNSTLTIGGYQEILENSDNLFGIIETNMADSTWNFAVSENFGSRHGGQTALVGWLTDGQRRIDIYPVYHYQNPGKKSAIDLMVGSQIWLKGFEFIENGSPIGAVQVGPYKFVAWFSKKNDPMTNFVIGSSFAALMHEYQMDLDGGTSNF